MDTIRLLRTLATEMGGTVLAEGSRSVGFSMGQGKTKELFKLVATTGDRVVLEQVSGRERGKRAEVSTMAELRSGDAAENPPSPL